MFTRLLVIAATIGIITTGTCFLAADPVYASDKEGHGRTFVGSWVINGESDAFPPFTNLSSVIKDGILINTDPVFETGHGVWKRIGKGAFSFRFLHQVPPDDPAFPVGTSLVVTGEMVISQDGSSGSGPFRILFTNPDFGELLSTTGTVTAERITLGD